MGIIGRTQLLGSLDTMVRQSTPHFLQLCRSCSQYGGGPSHRLSPDDCPLALQDAFLERLGYTNIMRRARIGIDPELRHLLRFHTGPAMPHPGLGLNKCGVVLVLKGLVFPQWRKRPIVLIHSRLFLYPGKPLMFVTFLVKLGRNNTGIYQLVRDETNSLFRLQFFKTNEKNSKNHKAPIYLIF